MFFIKEYWNFLKVQLGTQIPLLRVDLPESIIFYLNTRIAIFNYCLTTT
jgi:hypothetical protein